MKYGLGITTHREGDKRTSEQIREIVKTELMDKLSNAKNVEIKLSYGVYKGSFEPSVTPTFEGSINHFDFAHILKFKKKYKQDSILLYEYKKDSPAIIFENIDDIKVFQNKLMEFTKNQMGEYLTYLYEEKKAFILCVKDFGMDCKTFSNLSLLAAKKFNGRIFQTKNKVI